MLPLRFILSFTRFIPFIFSHLKNPIAYVAAYFKNRNQAAHFYNGLIVPTDSRLSFGFVNAIFFQKIYGKPEKNWQTIVDIGANRGYFSLFAAQNAPNAHIYAIEPFGETFGVLNKNRALNHLESRIETFNFAILDTDGYSPFYMGEDLLDHSLRPDILEKQQSTLVETRSLSHFMDTQNIEKIDMLKMNCEGSEYAILMNLPSVYLQRIEHIRLEYHTYEPDLTIDILAHYLENQGFDCVRIKRFHVKHGIAWFEKVKSKEI